MNAFRLLVPPVLIAAAGWGLVLRRDRGILLVLGVILGVLVFFSGLSAALKARRSAMHEEIAQRTVTWWWMVAVFMLALATHKIVSFAFLGFLCFAALREYYGLVPDEPDADGRGAVTKDRPSMWLSYLSIPVVAWAALAGWYELFIILVPVYGFLLVPVLFVLQDKTRGAIRSMGVVVLGFMFFVFSLGHCLFMINIGAMVLLYCFTLTEARDLVSYWIGKGFARWACARPEGALGRALRRRVAPSVSPNKTWAAGAAAAVCVAGLSAAMAPLMPEFPEGRFSYAFAAGLGLLIGWVGLMGDLVFSMVKRDVGAKDSGAVLPGHGGVIDRVDSLIFTVPITFHMIYWVYF